MALQSVRVVGLFTIGFSFALACPDCRAFRFDQFTK